MQTSLFRGPLFRGLAILAFFAGVGLVLVPIYVPRPPAFIPGFAPPPDMWPRTVSIIGAALGLLAVFLAATGGRSGPAETLETDGAPLKAHLMRFIGVVVAFAGFLLLVPMLAFSSLDDVDCHGDLADRGTWPQALGYRARGAWPAAFAELFPFRARDTVPPLARWPNPLAFDRRS